MTVRNMESAKGTGNTVANQFIITDGGLKVFQSYKSKICEWDAEGTGVLTVYSDWDYGNTTRTYFAKFINEETQLCYSSRRQWIAEMMSNPKIVAVL